LINGVTASFTGFRDEPPSINNTVNGRGLPGNTPALTGVHNASDLQNAWFGGGRGGSINFNLNGLYDLDGFSFWNSSGTRSDSGIFLVKITTSTDGTNYTDLIGAPIFFDRGTGSGVPQEFAFAPTPASHVRFLVLSNHGNNFNTGFSEVQFSAAPTAVPFEFNPVSGLVVLGLGFGLSKLRKKAVIK
jgi:hypothetical protein